MPLEPLIKPKRSRKTAKFLKLSMEAADGKVTSTEIELSELWAMVKYSKKFGMKRIIIDDAIQKQI